MRIISFLAFLGNLYRLNATRLAFRIRSKAGGHFLYVQTLQSFQIPKPPAAFKVFITSTIQALVSDMFEAKVGVKGPHPLQKHWVSPRLKMAPSMGKACAVAHAVDRESPSITSSSPL